MSAVFCDWLTIYQHHAGPVLEFIDGRILRIDADGALDWETPGAHVLKGSWDTSIRVSSFGGLVRLSGNIGRFGRVDNVFGYSVDDCVNIANEVLLSHGLPAFTPARLENHGLLKGGSGHHGGATISRVDLTQNFETGSQDHARDYIAWLSSQQPGRIKAKAYGDNSTVTWGEGSKYVYTKVYNKWTEILSHRGRSVGANGVLEYVHNSGLVRAEVSLKSRFLTQKNLNIFGTVTEQMWSEIFMEKIGTILSPKVVIDEWKDIPQPYLGTFLMWREGVDCAGKLSRRTFYRHRAHLRMYGIDIAISVNVRALPVRVREVHLRAVDAPDWYWKAQADLKPR